ncbi:acylphosphatase [Ligilactobacillus salitolerans]|uniref:acylphosphatase n=1 Tax=Ligilactobacillus salitolerans TaxID=1808352 RepID=A0A401IVN8_9LACO|nr:acylphosphatase [Ligilactobacillus salitolerans]GBG95582.1 acylphosphatase [Ligilactobacillus salitolerans]
MKAIKMTVSGMVQGVGFRYTSKMLADKLNVAGIVRNQMDGDVYIEAQGDSDNLAKFIAGIKDSPSPAGRVTDVKISEIPLGDYTKFDVVY